MLRGALYGDAVTWTEDVHGGGRGMSTVSLGGEDGPAILVVRHILSFLFTHLPLTDHFFAPAPPAGKL